MFLPYNSATLFSSMRSILQVRQRVLEDERDRSDACSRESFSRFQTVGCRKLLDQMDDGRKTKVVKELNSRVFRASFSNPKGRIFRVSVPVLLPVAPLMVAVNGLNIAGCCPSILWFVGVFKVVLPLKIGNSVAYLLKPRYESGQNHFTNHFTGCFQG